MDPFSEMHSDDSLDADVAAIFELPAPAPALAAEPVQAPAPAPNAEPAEGVVAPSPSAEPAPAEPSPPASPAPAIEKPLTPLEPTPSPAATPAPAPSDDPEARLRARSEAVTVEALQAKIAELEGRVTAPQPTPPAQPGNDGPPEEARLNLVVPNDVAAAIFDPDQAKAHAGLNHLVTGISTVILTKALQLVDQRIGNLRAEVQTPIAEAEARTEAKKIETRYFELNPAHNKPAIQPILREVNAQMAAEFRNSPIDDTYLSAMGARVNRRLAELVGEAQPQTPAPAPTPAAPTPPARPAAMVPAAPRPAPAGEMSLPEEVEAIFSATD